LAYASNNLAVVFTETVRVSSKDVIPRRAIFFGNITVFAFVVLYVLVFSAFHGRAGGEHVGRIDSSGCGTGVLFARLT
jgi:hypothetical protein